MMPVYHVDGCAWVASSLGAWLPGSFKTERAARMAFLVDPVALSAAWEAKRGLDGTIAEDDDFTEDEIRALIDKK